MSMEDERRLRNMCNLSEGFWEAGKKEGRLEEKLDNIKTALDVGLDEEKIQQIFKVSEEELEELKQKLYTCV